MSGESMVDAEKVKKNHVWYRVEPTVLLLSTLFAILSTVIALVAWRVAANSESQKLKLEYVRLAIGILQPAKKDADPQEELRGWAVDVLADSSPVPLSSETKAALIKGTSNLPRGDGGDYHAYDSHAYDGEGLIKTATEGQSNQSKPGN